MVIFTTFVPQKKCKILKLQQRIELLAELGRFIQTEKDHPDLQAAIQRSWIENKWFTPDNTRAALDAIAATMLDEQLLKAWADQYPLRDKMHPERTIGMVMAGNIPLVGFHDWLCVFMSGERARIKLSGKDFYLLPFLIQLMGQWEHESRAYTTFCAAEEPLRGFDAVIATGSNNTARYFEQYFSPYPHIIRRNRNAVGVLDGTEGFADLYALGRDIFTYFGLGCRNVSKIYVPRGYQFDALMEALHEYRDLAHHDKYRNNFDYNMTLFLLNKISFLNNGCIILKEDASISSRIACLHYSFYENEAALQSELQERAEEIQCIVGKKPLPNSTVIPFGQSQTPGLTDYPDGVDVMAWLTNSDKP